MVPDPISVPDRASRVEALLAIHGAIFDHVARKCDEIGGTIGVTPESFASIVDTLVMSAERRGIL